MDVKPNAAGNFLAAFLLIFGANPIHFNTFADNLKPSLHVTP